MSQVQNIHRFLLSEEKDKDTRIVRKEPESEKKKLQEKVEKQGKTQITTEPEVLGEKTSV